MSIAVALLVPAVVLAQSVTFAPGDVLDAVRMNALARRTLDKRNIYVVTTNGPTDLTTSQVDRVTAVCSRGTEDIMLDCGCSSFAPGSDAVAVRTARMALSGEGTSAATQTCVCAAQNVGTGANRPAATAVCINIPE